MVEGVIVDSSSLLGLSRELTTRPSIYPTGGKVDTIQGLSDITESRVSSGMIEGNTPAGRFIDNCSKALTSNIVRLD